MVCSTAFIAAVLIGDITSAMPMPMSTKPGSRKSKPEVGVRKDCHSCEVACAEQNDLRAIASLGAVEGAIVGKALYAGAFTLPEALAAVSPR